MLIHFFITFLLLIFPITSLSSNENTVNTCAGGSRDTTNLWRIRTDPPSFFFGTVHAPYTRVWGGISISSHLAFQSADKAYFELGKVPFKFKLDPEPPSFSRSSFSIQGLNETVFCQI